MMKIIHKTSFTFVYKNCFQTILSKNFVKNKNIRPEEYKYKIEEFNPKQSKYSINKNHEIRPQGEMPKFLEKEELIKKQNIEEESSQPKRGISLKGLKSGKRLTIIKKPFQKKMTKEQLKLNKEKLELETKLKDKQISKEERLLIENKEHALMRHEGNFIEQENLKYKNEIKEMRQKRVEMNRIFNTESLANFQKEERLSKRLARLGVTSRRQAEKLIESGMIKINGRTVTQNVPVTDETNIQVYSSMGYKTPMSESTRVWLFYKPTGFVCTKNDEKGRLSIYKFLEERKFPVKHFSVAVKLFI